MSGESLQSAACSSEGSSDSMSNPNSTSSPLAMAASARDRFQASARELFKNLEEALSIKKDDTSNNSTSKETAMAAPWESAIRTMFSSCTTGAESNTLGQEADYASPSSTIPTPRASKVVVTPTHIGRGGDEGARVSVHHHGTTAVSPAQVPMPKVGHPNDVHEHIYAQLFFDDQIRAAKAVKAHRKQDPTFSTVQQHQFLQNQQVPHPPPIHLPPTPSTLLSPPLTSTELDISRNLTFDDSISAISAHTLEAMANNMKHMNSDLTKSSESSLFPPESNEKSSTKETQLKPKTSPVTVVSPPTPTLGASKSPFSTKAAKGFDSHHHYHSNENPIVPIHSRSRSNNSRHSKNSHSTRTTESSSFDNWHQEEKKYWVHVAHKEEKQEQVQQRRGPFRNKARILPPIGGTTNPRSPHRHPHDTTLEINMINQHSSSSHNHRSHQPFGAYECEEDPVAMVDNTSRYRMVPAKNKFKNFTEI